MPQNAKHFATQLNEALNNISAPDSLRERSLILSKLVDIPKQDAWSLLEGQSFPRADLLQKIVTELEVDMAWLIGESAN